MKTLISIFLLVISLGASDASATEMTKVRCHCYYGKGDYVGFADPNWTVETWWDGQLAWVNDSHNIRSQRVTSTNIILVPPGTDPADYAKKCKDAAPVHHGFVSPEYEPGIRADSFLEGTTFISGVIELEASCTGYEYRPVIRRRGAGNKLRLPNQSVTQRQSQGR